MNIREAWHAYSRFHYKLVSFLVRRVVAPGFVVVGSYAAIVNSPALLPGGTTLVNGAESTDIVLRLAIVILPLVVALLGVALFRAKPVTPSRGDEGDA